jgi:hypothetical protein
MFALWIGLGRQIVAPVALFRLPAHLPGMELADIGWGIFGINGSAAAMMWFYARRQLQKAGTDIKRPSA